MTGAGYPAAEGSRGRSRWPAQNLAAPGIAKSWRRPMFPKGCPLSIFGAGELDFRVRYGNGYGLSASVTRILLLNRDRLQRERSNPSPRPRSRDPSISSLLSLESDPDPSP